jgi:hypothetical protein
MATKKQIAANRLNAQKSCGPCTAEGKAASRLNALKFGVYAKTPIIFDESPDDLAELAAECHDEYLPAGLTERSLVDTLSNIEWRHRRLRRSEAALWEHAANNILGNNILDDGQAVRVTPGAAFAAEADRLAKCQQIVTFCERKHQRALTELRRLRAAPPETED